MEPTRLTGSELQQAFGSLDDNAAREPIVISKHDRGAIRAPRRRAVSYAGASR